MENLNKSVWLKHENGGLYYITSEDKKGHLYGYGFDKKGNWIYNVDEKGDECALNNVAKNHCTQATTEEVTERFMEEAKRRGYLKGVKIYCPYCESNQKISSNKLDFDTYFHRDYPNGALRDSVGVVIFHDGIWSEIVKEDKQTTESLEHKTLCQAYKEKNNKLNYELDFNFITQLAERMQANKGKYEPYNWQKLDNIEDLKQALFRHVTEVMKGNYKDDNRLFGHLEAIALNSMFINYQLNK